MEVLLFALFFISALIFFISGKDDFGRTNNKLIIQEKEQVKKDLNSFSLDFEKSYEQIDLTSELKISKNLFLSFM